tara:strand:- start:145 stop:432 length:288 start_codon:yes stop_codon:yes gene_type:complete
MDPKVLIGISEALEKSASFRGKVIAAARAGGKFFRDAFVSGIAGAAASDTYAKTKSVQSNDLKRKEKRFMSNKVKLQRPMYADMKHRKPYTKRKR